MRKKRILIVDDESGFLRLLKLGLEKKGNYRVHEENDSTQAVEAALKFNPDLILLDFVMPKAHGADVAAKFREHAQFHLTPILFLSGTVQKRKGDTVQIQGFEALAKPIGLDELIAAIERNLALVEAANGRRAGLFSRIGEAFQRLSGKAAGV